MATKKPYGYWQRNIELLQAQAQTLSSAEIAKAHGMTEHDLRNKLSKLGIKAPPKVAAPDPRIAQLQALAAHHTAAQIAVLLGTTVRAVYQQLARRGIKALIIRPDVWAQRSKQLEQDAKTHTAAQLAEMYKLDRKYLYRILHRFDITPLPSAPSRPARYGTKPASPMRTAKPSSKALAPVPSRSSIATRAPAQIIMPAHVKVQHIPLPTAPDGYRICNGSMREAYNPSRHGQ